ncbi:MAG: CDP-diacylglycerol--serine O-phosphatidyltransferase [Bradymonadia bacterium]|jgi:CDP-diacylglycerol--serine O-phosphatidyltransferase
MSKPGKTKIHPKYFVPNAFTALSMLFGLASIMTSAAGNFTLAAWMILWGVLLDKLDGTSARLFNASSDFGMEFDSFADFVVFGISPAALVYFRLQETMGENRKLFLMMACGIFVVATAMRLCRFNISDPPGGENIFYGIPSTLCGAFLASAFLTWDKYFSAHPDFLRVLPAALIVCGVALVSNIKLPKLKPRKKVIFNIFQVVNIVAVYACTAMMLLPEYMLGLLILYVAIGGVWALLNPPDLSAYDTEDGDAPETPVASA